MFPKRVLIRCVVRPDWDDLTGSDCLGYVLLFTLTSAPHYVKSQSHLRRGSRSHFILMKQCTSLAKSVDCLHGKKRRFSVHLETFIRILRSIQDFYLMQPKNFTDCHGKR